MNESHDNRLDHLLNDWARSREVSADALASLQRKIQDRIAAEPGLSPLLAASEPFSTRRKWRFAVAALGMAATLLIGLAGWWGYMRSESPQERIAHMLDQPSIPAAPTLADRAQLLAEYQDLFGPEFAWLVEQPSRAEIGLQSLGSQRATRPREYVAVRLMLFARPSSGSEWKEVQDLNVVARREEFVEVSADAENGAALIMWAYPLDGDKISIDLRYEPSRFAGRAGIPDGLSIESSRVQSMGESAPIYSFERDGMEYRLYQSADLLPGNGVG